MINVLKIKPVYNRVITTADRYEESATYNGSTILDANKLEGRYKEYQTVVAVGNSVREFKPGDVVLIDPSRYMRRKFSDNSLREDFVENPIVSIDIPTVQMDGKDYFMINDQDIVYTIEDYEEVPDPVKPTIITPREQKIIL